jgi:sphingosine kinase
MKHLRKGTGRIAVVYGHQVHIRYFGSAPICADENITGTANTRAIPFYNILWAELQDDELTIDYASPASKTVVRAATLKYPFERQTLEAVHKWVIKLLDRAYGESQRMKRTKVLVNPHSGKGSAEKWYYRDVEPLLKAARCPIDMQKTKYNGEAVEIAEKLDIESFDLVAACSGDGLPYEVFNGFGKRPDAKKALTKIAVVNIPCGSGNAMSWNLNGTDSCSLATLAVIKGLPTPLDLISITQGETRTLSFLSQSVGIVAESDLATEHLRWMGGQRFVYGFLVRLWGKALYPCDIAVKVAIDDKPSIKEHYRRERNNHEPASERRGYKNLLDDDASASSGNDDALPPLRYGTVNDKLPEGWVLVPYDKLGNFYCGNVSPPFYPQNIITHSSRWHTWQLILYSSNPPSPMTATWIWSASTATSAVSPPSK